MKVFGNTLDLFMNSDTDTPMVQKNHAQLRDEITTHWWPSEDVPILLYVLFWKNCWDVCHFPMLMVQSHIFFTMYKL
jgi:hypothetical protein